MSMTHVSSGRIALRFGFHFVCFLACLGAARAAQAPVMFTEADGDTVAVELRGPGSFTGTLAGLTITGTKATSKLLVTVTPGGGDGRATLGGIAAAAGIGSIDAPAGVLDGALSVSGKLGKLTLIATSDAATATATALGAVKMLDGDLRGTISTPGKLVSLTVTGGDVRARIGAGSIGPIKVVKSVGGAGGSIVDSLIAAATKITAISVAGDVTNSKILAGVMLGSDLALGGTGADADVFGAGKVGRVSIGGAMTSSILGAGLSPFDGVFGNGNDGIFGGKRSALGAFTVIGALSVDSLVGAGKFAVVKVAGVRIRVPALDPRFITRKLVPSKLPPDPATVASAINPTVASNLADRIAFLYTGRNPVQTGVAPGTIKPGSAAVVRGTVKNQGGAALAGAMVTVLEHTEYGETFTRADGMFDFALNGGATYSFLFEKEGFCPVQRQVTVPPQDAVMLADVAMMTLDPAATTVALGTGSAMQMHTATMQSDADGDRQAALMFAPGTEASLVMPDGTMEPVASLKIRATEFTVGAQGPAAMPGTLPGTSAYTYCAELTADEAIAADATTIVFNQPVWLYVDNFTNFTVGIDVPSGFFNRKTGLWEAGPSGKVMKVVSIASDLADIDTDGNDVADNTGIGDGERAQLAQRFAAGATFWRVPIPHFSPWDCNWPFGPPANATPPNGKQPKPLDQPKDPDCCDGSVIIAPARVLGEGAGLVGVPFGLNYRSDRVPGRKVASRARIPLSGATVPASLKRIELDVEIAGRMFHQEFAATPNLETTFEWDGLDSYERRLQGRQPAQIDIGFVYDGEYQQAARFGFNGGGLPITGSRTRQEITLHSRYTVQVGVFDIGEQSLGGWAFNIHHAYDPAAQTLYEGGGNVRAATSVGSTITTIAGTGFSGFSGDGGPARLAQFSHPSHVDVGPDGSLFVSDRFNNRIRRIAPDGTITTVGGNGQTGADGDGGPATAAQIEDPVDLRVGADGSIYICPDDLRGKVRRISPEGIITTVAGTGLPGFSGDDGPATSAQLSAFLAVRPAADGSLYVADLGNNRLRRVMPDGTIHSVMGPTGGFSGDGGPAFTAGHGSLLDPTPGSAGDVIVADWSNNRLRRITPDGIINNFAGGGIPPMGNGDGGPATAAKLNLTDVFGGSDLDLGPDGSLYFTQRSTSTIRRVSPDGIITTIAGNGTAGRGGDGGPALAAELNFTGADICVGPDGSIYVPDASNHIIRKISPPLPGFTGGQFVIPSEDGLEVFTFDRAGRHLATRSALTGATLYTFGYDAAGRLVKVTDAGKNVVIIQRDGAGNPTAVIAPFGQRTRVTTNAEGFLASLTDPEGGTTVFTYSAGGLLASETDPLGTMHTFTYDTAGNLVQDDEPGTRASTLAEPGGPGSGTVTFTTSGGRVFTFDVQETADGSRVHTNTDAAGLATTTIRGANGSNVTVTPDGTQLAVQSGPDPRWKYQAPLEASRTSRAPSGLSATVTTSATATLSDPVNPLSATQLTRTSALNGNALVTSYDAATRTVTVTSPEGRTLVRTLDEAGRVLTVKLGDFLPLTATYDARGRMTAIRQGAGEEQHAITFAYDAAGFLAKATDALGRATMWSYDRNGRIESLRVPDGGVVAYEYDAAGNRTGVTPPGRPKHAFAYELGARLASYTPPGSGATTFGYSTDGDLASTTGPDAAALALGHDAGGRLATVTTPAGQNTIAYHATSGRPQTLTADSGVVVTLGFDGTLPTSQTFAGPVTGSVTTTFDNAFRIATRTVNALPAVSHTYDRDNLPTGVGALTIARDAASGFITTTTLGTITDSRAYNEFGGLAGYTAQHSGADIYSYTLTYNRLGLVASRAETIGGVSHTDVFAYDANGRLVSVTRDGGALRSYTYDTNDNRVTANDSAGARTFTCNDRDQIVSAGSVAYTFNTNGSLASRGPSGQVTQFQYDVLGNLRSVTLPDATQIDYLHDARNRRVGRKVGSVLVQGFLYAEDGRPVAELDGSNNVVARFFYAGLDALTPEFILKNGNTYRVLADRQGSVRMVVDTATGAVAQRIDYDEFGVVLADSAPGFQPFGFCGGLYDAATGLVRFGARDYDAAAGRWTARDPILFAGDGPNLYAYVNNSPLNASDPSGLATVTAGFFSFLGIGHAAVKVNDGPYVGLGPKSADAGDIFSGKDVPGVVGREHNQWGNLCYEIVFEVSDEQARDICDFLFEASRTPQRYNGGDRNCAIFAKEALARGGIRTPFNVGRFASGVALGLLYGNIGNTAINYVSWGNK